MSRRGGYSSSCRRIDSCAVGRSIRCRSVGGRNRHFRGRDRNLGQGDVLDSGARGSLILLFGCLRDVSRSGRLGSRGRLSGLGVCWVSWASRSRVVGRGVSGLSEGDGRRLGSAVVADGDGGVPSLGNLGGAGGLCALGANCFSLGDCSNNSGKTSGADVHVCGYIVLA